MRYATLVFISFLHGLIFPAHALTINAGDSYTFNFDLTSATPAPPYDRVQLSWNFDPDTIFNDGETDSGTIALFGGLNATGSTISWADDFWSDGSFGTGLSTPDSALLDGRFSVVFTGVEGTAELSMLPVASGRKDNTWSDDIPGVLATSVPEPATIALIGLGLVGLGATCRKAKPQ